MSMSVSERVQIDVLERRVEALEAALAELAKPKPSDLLHLPKDAKRGK